MRRSYADRGCWRRALLMVPLVLMLAAANHETGEEGEPAGGVVYVPPDLGAPPTRTLAAVRGQEGDAVVHVLAAERTGWSLDPDPVLFWYQGAPPAGRLEVTVIDDRAIAPLLEAPLDGVERPGIHAVDLGAFGLRLEPGVEYQWSIAEVVDPEQRSADLVSSGTILYRPDSALAAEIEALPPDAAVIRLAARGYWYDALEILAERLAAEPGDASSRALRTALLTQVGLDEVARHERAVAAAQ